MKILKNGNIKLSLLIIIILAIVVFGVYVSKSEALTQGYIKNDVSYGSILQLGGTATIGMDNPPYGLIVQGGKVGVGITNPTALVDVYNNTTASVNVLKLTNSADAANEYAGIELGPVGYTSYIAGVRLSGGYSPTALAFYTHPAAPVNNTEVMRIDSTGYVGIGTSAPLSKLSVGGAGIANTGVYGINSFYGIAGVSTGTGGGSTGVHGAGLDGVIGYGSYRGVYGESTGSTSFGVYGNGVTYGVYGIGETGVNGNGDIYGVAGDGDTGGVFTGVTYGVNAVSQGTGVKGAGYNYGVYGTASLYGLYGVGVQGVHGEGSNIGIYASGTVADFYAGGPGSNYQPFTGGHEVKLSSKFPKDARTGLIVSVTGETQTRKYNKSVSISSTLPTVELSKDANDNKVFGAFVAYTVLPEDHWYLDKLKKSDRFATVNALGEGRVLVTNINGNIEAGDYITTSEIAGYGMRQKDNLLHSYTLGKSIENIDWSNVKETINFQGKEYKVYLMGVIYTSG